MRFATVVTLLAGVSACSGDSVGGPDAAVRMTVVVSSQSVGGLISTGANFDEFDDLRSGSVWYPRHSPDGAHLAYIDYDDLQHKMIRVLDRAGREVAAIDLGQQAPWSIAWNSTGESIFFSAIGSGGGRWVWRRDDEPFPTDVIGSRDQIAHSPTAPTLAITRDFDIWIQSANGGPARNLTGDVLPGSTEHRPRWSPDGQTIVFVATGPGAEGSGLYTIDVSGEGLTRVASSVPAEYVRAIFSPDGRKLLAHRQRADETGSELVLLPLDGSTETVVGAFDWRASLDFSWR